MHYLQNLDRSSQYLISQTLLLYYKLNGDVSDSDNIVITKADIEK